MEKYLNILRKSPFFTGISDEEILTMLNCVEGKVIQYEKGQFIFRAGDTTDVMGIVLSGKIFVIQEDYWGHRNILNKCETGDFFGEIYAATPGSVLNVSIVTEENAEVLLLNMRHLLTTCHSSCDHHNKLIRNLTSVMARKVLALNDKITHISKRTTREKLMSYLSSEAEKRAAASFDIPYDRQQLADFLCVERAAMSAELSKMQKDGLIRTNRNHFEILTGDSYK